MIIGVDKGHAITGPRGAAGILDEVNEDRLIGNRLIQILREKGHTVIDCACDVASDVNSQLAAICAKANAQHLDMFISIHLNAGGGNGTEIYEYAVRSAIEPTAKRILDDVAASCGFFNRGVKTANYYVLRNTNAPACLLEVCFVDSAQDAKILNVENVARAIFKGITGVDYVPTATVAHYGVVNTATLNVRSGAGTQYPVIGTLSKGQKVQIGSESNSWYSIYFGEHGGFVSSQYLTI